MEFSKSHNVVRLFMLWTLTGVSTSGGETALSSGP
jgi:hypothetical protein